MITGKTIKFGYGTVSVGCDPLSNIITFQEIKPPYECGSIINQDENIEFIGNIIKIYLDFDNYSEFNKLLQTGELANGIIFEFEGYTFDFSNYNINSINVCRDKAKAAMCTRFLCMAC